MRTHVVKGSSKEGLEVMGEPKETQKVVEE